MRKLLLVVQCRSPLRCVHIAGAVDTIKLHRGGTILDSTGADDAVLAHGGQGVVSEIS